MTIIIRKICTISTSSLRKINDDNKVDQSLCILSFYNNFLQSKIHVYKVEINYALHIFVPLCCSRNDCSIVTLPFSLASSIKCKHSSICFIVGGVKSSTLQLKYFSSEETILYL